MAHAGGGAVETLFVELGLDPQKFFSGVDSAVTKGGAQAEEFGRRSSTVMSGIAKAAAVAGVAVAGIFSVQAIKNAISVSAEYGEALDDIMDRTGMAADAAGKLVFAFEHYGLTADDANRALGILSKKLKGIQDDETGVATGGKSTAQILGDIGIQATDAAGNIRPMAELLPAISDYFTTLPDGAEKTGLAMQLFGRSGAVLLDFLNSGSEGLKELGIEADKLGLLLSEEQVADLENYGRVQRDLAAGFKGLKLVIGVALIPVLTKLSKWAIDMQPAIRKGVGKAVQWLGVVFGTLGRYIQNVVKTGKTWNEALDNLPAPLKLLLYLVGEVVVSLKDIAEWLLKAADTVVDWGKKIAGILPDGKKMGDHFDSLQKVVPLVADAIAGLLAVMIVSQVVSFALAMGKVATSILTFPVREAQAAATAVGNFVAGTASLVSKAVTVTMNVVQTGAELIRSLPWMTQEITQLVKRTGSKWIEDFTPKTQEVTQAVVSGKVGITGGEKAAASGKDMALRFAGGFVAGLGALIATNAAAIAAWLGAVAVAVGGVLAAVTPVGWVVIAAVIVALIVAALGIIFRDKVVAFFRDDLPRFFAEALPQFAAALPGWAGQLVGMIAGAIVFALIGIPLIIGRALADGIKRAGPAVAKAIGDLFSGIGGPIKKALGKVPWGAIEKQLSGWMTGRTQLNLLTKAWEGLGDVLGKIPWDSIEKGLNAFMTGKAQLALFRRSLDLVTDGFKELPGAVASIPGIIGDLASDFAQFAQDVPGYIHKAFDAIPGIVSGALTGAGGLAGIVGGALADMVGDIAATPVGEAVKGVMDNMWQGFKDGWSRIDELTGGSLTDIITAIGGILDDAWTLGSNIVNGFWSGLTAAFGMPFEWGKKIVNGIWNGILSLKDWIIDKAKDFGVWIFDAVKAGLGAIWPFSPSEAGVDIGWGLVAGIEKGLRDNIGRLKLPTFNLSGVLSSSLAMATPLASLTGGGIAASSRAAPIFNFNMPLSMTGFDLAAMRRLVHTEIDQEFDDAERRAYLSGAPLSGSIG